VLVDVKVREKENSLWQCKPEREREREGGGRESCRTSVGGSSREKKTDEGRDTKGKNFHR